MNNNVLSRQQRRNESILLMEPSGWTSYIDSDEQGVLRVQTGRGSMVAKTAAAIAAVGLVLSPAFAASTSTAKKRPPAVSLSFNPISSFTPANGDPRLAAAFASKPLALTDFKFTPAAAK